MRSVKRLATMGLGLVLMTGACAESLAVFYDSGDTQALAPFLDILDEPPANDIRAVPSAPALGAADIKHRLPIRSPGLTVGAVVPRAIKRPFTAPLFLIGADARSERWLIQHRARLAQLGAVGMLVEVPDEAALDRLTELARGLILLPASGSDLAKSLELTHYPVLITQEGIEQ